MTAGEDGGGTIGEDASGNGASEDLCTGGFDRTSGGLVSFTRSADGIPIEGSMPWYARAGCLK